MRFTTPVLPRDSQARKLGFGAKLRPGMGRGDGAVQTFLGNLQTQLRYPNYYVPIIEQCRIHYPGALTDQAVEGSFGNLIDPFGSSANTPPPGAIAVESTMVDPGKVQQFTIVVGVGFVLEPEPFQATIKCNSWTAPATSSLKPVSPDAMTLDDINLLSTGVDSLGLPAGANFAEAVLQWGWWQNYAFYYMCEAYNLQWQVAHNMTIINDPLRYTAHVPSRAQEGSASNSEVDVLSVIRRTNDYYRSLGSQFTALSIDHTRVGYLSGGEGPQVALYRASRAYDTVGATFGGMGLTAQLSRNPEFRRLSAPYILRPGVPIGLRAVVSNTDDQINMQNQLKLSCGFNSGTFPAAFTEDVNVATGSPTVGTATGSIPGTANFTGAELSLDSPPVNNSKPVPVVRHIYKGGPFKIAVSLRGWEVDEDTAKALQDKTIAEIIQQDTGLTLMNAS